MWNGADPGSNSDVITNLSKLALNGQELVIAIYFESMHSGVAWCGVEGPETRTLATWSSSRGSIVVPSEIRYTCQGLELGHQIPPSVERHSQFKL